MARGFVYLVAVMDWDQDGDWGGSSNCPSGLVSEHVPVDLVVPALYIGPLSALVPTGFTIWPNGGYAWVRFSISESRVGPDWDGEAVFEDGESIDYLLQIVAPTDAVPTLGKWGLAILLLFSMVTELVAVTRNRQAKN